MDFNKAYNRTDFINFVRTEFLPEDYLENVETKAPDGVFKYSCTITKIGECKSLELDVFEIIHTSTNDARVSLSKESFRILSQCSWHERALIAFVPEDNPANYRISLVCIDRKWDGDRKSKEYSNPRRYSYFLGEGIGTHTPDKYLKAGGRITDFKDLKTRFSVEILTKAFYNELSDWYAWAIKIIRFPNDINSTSDDTAFNSESAIRLITRLIFVWFLKQKHLIPEEFFDENYISTYLLKDFEPNLQTGLFLEKSVESKYYKAILQNLFFAMLNSPITLEGKTTISERRFSKGRQDFDNNKLMRYKDMFLNPDLFIEIANKTVPFLNGGLFDCLDEKDKGLYYDGFSERDIVQKSLVVPDYLFFGEDIGRNTDLSGYYGNVKKNRVNTVGIIDILKRYNFTVEENTPSDQEISLDPELLGKVFENLLASFNPETQSTARKQTGSFYTPREIVQYMVDESLVAHLKHTVGEELEEEYRNLMRYTDEHVSLTEEQKLSVMHSLYNCKILDPACGSGAFPMGVLQQMVHILSQLDPDNDQWKTILMENAINETSEAYQNATDEERKEMVMDIERSFNDDINRPDYARKLYLIEHCIFGVDIQSIAVQISKLRFFISLVVDQITNSDPADNFGIRPLPNLEAKFVAANTLIELKKNDTTLFDSEGIQTLQDEMMVAKHKIFGAKTHKTKMKYKVRVTELRLQIADLLKVSGVVGNEEAKQMADWDMFDQNSSSPFFDPEWMFGLSLDNGGYFDIVIGNPPYVVVPNRANLYSSFVTKQCLELYAYFFEQAIKLLKENGILSFITASLYVKGLKFVTLRNFLQSHSELIEFKYQGDSAFDQVQMPTSTFICKKQVGAWSFNDLSQQDPLIKRIEKNTGRLSDISSIMRGLEIGRNVIRDTGEYQILTGTTVQKYWYSRISYISKNILISFAKDEKYFTGERLLIRETGSSLLALYLSEPMYCNRSLYSVKITNSHYYPKYVLACLNSKVLQFYYSQKFKGETELFPKIRIAQAKLLPIPTISETAQQPLVTLVDKILRMKQKSPSVDTSFLEAEIDKIVYVLYGLSENEIEIIEGK